MRTPANLIDDKARRSKLSKKSTTSKKSRPQTPTIDEMTEGLSPLAATLNVVSSDTFVDHSHSPALNRRRNKTTNAKIKQQDGYKKMNKEPLETSFKLPSAAPKYSPKSAINTKNSAHVTHRSRVPAITQHF